MLFYRKALSAKRKKNACFEHFMVAFCASSIHLRLGNDIGKHRCRKVSTCRIFLWFCFTFPKYRIDFALRIFFWATTFPFALYRRFANVKSYKMNTCKQTALSIPLIRRLLMHFAWLNDNCWINKVGVSIYRNLTKFGEKCVWMRSVDKCVRKYDACALEGFQSEGWAFSCNESGFEQLKQVYAYLLIRECQYSRTFAVIRSYSRYDMNKWLRALTLVPYL